MVQDLLLPFNEEKEVSIYPVCHMSQKPEGEKTPNQNAALQTVSEQKKEIKQEIKFSRKRRSKARSMMQQAKSEKVSTVVYTRPL
jgi:hypothetical protein